MLHIKKNHVLLVFWIIIFGFTQGWLGGKYGVSDQFLYPEYRGASDVLSFALTGFAFGGFVLAFNLYTYILHGFRFAFIATLNRPFLKFSINNFIIPFLYILVYAFHSARYQANSEFVPTVDIALHLLSFVGGMFAFLLVSVLYFRYTNKDILSFAGKKKQAKIEQDESENLAVTAIHRKSRWFLWGKRYRRWHVETYMSSFRRIALARGSSHYHKDTLEKVFKQHHVNASIFEVALVLTFILIGSFREIPAFVIPAAASVILFFTIQLMVFSALFSWFKGWTLTIMVGLLLVINFTYMKFGFMNVPNHAYGLKYDGELADYSRSYLHAINDKDSLARADFEHGVQILDNWRRRQQSETVIKGKKPKLVIVNTSGGGLRSAYWTMESLLTADSLLDGRLMNQTQLICGSSGGMMGAAYVRELHHRVQLGDTVNLYGEWYRDDICMDLLNPILFSIATNDFFIRYQKFREGDDVYTKDRGYSFEKQFNLNTRGFLNKRMIDYTQPEFEGLIPMVIMTPTIVNDGRRLVLSSQPVSYLTQNDPDNPVTNDAIAEDVEFSRLFEKQNSSNLKFTSALRMNATFPYVLPMVTLPSDPPIHVMDAGLRDNFGIKTTLQYLHTYRNWINTNTSGVVILQVRDIQKDFEARKGTPNLLNKFFAPLGSVYGNFTRMQDYTNDQLIKYMSAWFDNDIDVVTFQLTQDPEDKISLNFHLTQAEKKRIQETIDTEEYQAAVKQLRTLIE